MSIVITCVMAYIACVSYMIYSDLYSLSNIYYNDLNMDRYQFTGITSEINDIETRDIFNEIQITNEIEKIEYWKKMKNKRNEDIALIILFCEPNVLDIIKTMSVKCSLVYNWTYSYYSMLFSWGSSWALNNG